MTTPMTSELGCCSPWWWCVLVNSSSRLGIFFKDVSQMCNWMSRMSINRMSFFWQLSCDPTTKQAESGKYRQILLQNWRFAVSLDNSLSHCVCSKTGGSRPLILSLGLSDHSAVSLSKSIELQMNPDVDVFPYFPCISSHLYPWYMSVPGKLTQNCRWKGIVSRIFQSSLKLN